MMRAAMQRWGAVPRLLFVGQRLRPPLSPTATNRQPLSHHLPKKTCSPCSMTGGCLYRCHFLSSVITYQCPSG